MTFIECLPLLSQGRKVRRVSWPWPIRLTYKSSDGMKDVLQLEPTIPGTGVYRAHKEDVEANDWEVCV